MSTRRFSWVQCTPANPPDPGAAAFAYFNELNADAGLFVDPDMQATINGTLYRFVTSLHETGAVTHVYRAVVAAVMPGPPPVPYPPGPIGPPVPPGGPYPSPAG